LIRKELFEKITKQPRALAMALHFAALAYVLNRHIQLCGEPTKDEISLAIVKWADVSMSNAFGKWTRHLEMRRPRWRPIDGTHSLDILGRQTLDADWRSFQLAEMRMRWLMTLINFYSSILALSPQ
jgi:hypothetical protein